MTGSDHAILDLIGTPALLVREGVVRFANAAAEDLLGSHVLGQDVRIALRAPESVTTIMAAQPASVRIEGLSVPGSQWRLVCHHLEDGQRLVLLEDLSVRISVARAHTDFVANASHELRTPLASILGYVETLANPAAGEDEKTRQRFLEIIRHEAERMQALVEDLMSLSRIEAGKHDLPDDQVDMVSLARSCSNDADQGGRVSVSSNAEQAIVAGDGGQLAQALRNLIDNALKYGKTGGPVAVALEVTSAGRLSVTVHDDGDGIPPDDLPRLTERFYRVDTSRSRAVGGTGLGLSIVKHIVERHRGRFDITSRAGMGTTAAILLPLKDS